MDVQKTSRVASSIISSLRLPLWVVLVTPFIFIIVIVVGLTNYLAHQNSRDVINEMAQDLLLQESVRIGIELQSFLEIPEIVNRTNAHMIANEYVDLSDPDATGQFLLDQVQVYDYITSTYIGNVQGGLVSGGREGADGSYYVMMTDDFSPGPLGKYAVTDTGNLDDLLFTVPEFDSRVRPWYTGAIGDDDIHWTAPYVLSTGQDLAIASSLAVYDADGTFLGVASVDIFLSHIQSFLGGLKIGETGIAYIVDESGNLVATSTTAAVIYEGADRWERIQAQDSKHDIVAGTASQIFGDNLNPDIGASYQDTLQIDQTNYFVQVTPFQSIDGLDWDIVIAIPTRDFLGSIEAQTQITAILTIIAVILAAIIGSVISYQILHPVTRLSQAVTQISKGNWNQSIDIDGVREIRVLAGAFNQMTEQLQILFADLENRIADRTAELSESEARYRAVVQDQTELICLMTTDYDITFNNHAYCRFFVDDAGQLESSFMSYIMASDLDDTLAKLDQLAFDNAVVSIEHRVQRPDGKIVWLQWVCRALFDDSGEIDKIQSVGRDISATKKAEEERQQALEREIELGNLKSQFVTTVSHEFRTPLAVILNSTEILERYNDQLDDDKKQEHFAKIKMQIEHMTTLMQNVMAISKDNVEQNQSPAQVIDLITTCETIIEEVKISTKHPLNFQLNHEGLCDSVLVDSQTIRLILMNLISNAARFSPDDSTVSIDVACSNAEIQISVTDQGVGIPADDQDKIFEPFFRASNVRNYNGTGLGLSIMKRSVEQQNGTLSFVSKENEGTTFTVRLPQHKQRVK